MQRLTDDRRARRLTRFALRRMWAPVGSDVMPAAEVDHLIGFLFGGDDGRAMAERIDRRIDGLPGLAGLHLVTNASDKHQADPRPTDVPTPIRLASIAVGPHSLAA
jgi:hypothetical protein